MASKMDEDLEEEPKSVAKHLPSNEEKSDGLDAKQVKDNKDRTETSKVSKNSEIVNEVVGNFSGDESESETFYNASEDLNLNERMDSLQTTEAEVKNVNEVKTGESDAEEEEILTPEEREERKTQAQQYKERGNDYFKRSEYPEAKELYTSAIQICPDDFTKEKSVFYANRAACLVKMGQYKEAIEDCTKALDLNPDYLKVRLRRAQCYEQEDRLEEALEDYQKVFDADRSSHVAREALMRLPEQIRVKHEKMKEEMIGKLKELGNVFLRPFGLSTDNFKLTQDPNSGGYSVNFQK